MIKCNYCNIEKEKILFRIKKKDPICFECFHQQNRMKYRIKNPKKENICVDCGSEKQSTDFIKNTNCCRECKKIYRRKYYENNKSYYIEYATNLSKTEKRKSKKKEYTEKNKELIKEYQKEYREKNKESIKKKRKEYNKVRMKRNKYRYKNDPLYKMKKICRSMLNRVLKKLNLPKTSRTEKMLGYTSIDLKNHLEPLLQEGMTWENHGEWHIDHIIPISAFDVNTPISIINALSNLQPLWAIDNLRKSNTINK